MVRTVQNEFPEFPAALSFMPMLSADEARAQLTARLLSLGKEIAALRSVAADMEDKYQLPRLFAIEDEYRLAIFEAEHAWVSRILDDLASGDLYWDRDTIVPGRSACRNGWVLFQECPGRPPPSRTSRRNGPAGPDQAGRRCAANTPPARRRAKALRRTASAKDRRTTDRLKSPTGAARHQPPITVQGDSPMPESTTSPPVTTVTGVPVRGTRPVRPPLVIAIFCLGLFMTLLDITIVNIAIPDLVTDLDATLETVLWVGSAYSLTYTVLLITAGRLGDIHGPRRLFLIGLTLFTLASLASGLSQTSGQLIAFRALQGVGAALLAPQGLPMITSILPAARRGPAFAAIGIMSGLGVLLGPTLGGFLVTNFGWRWIFFLNIPVGILAITLAFVFMPDVRPGVPHRLDIPGMVLLTAGLFGVVFGLIEGERYDWGTISGFVSIPLVIAAGALLLGAFVWRQIRIQDAEPLLPFDVFHDRTFTVMTVVLLALGFAMVGVYLPMTIYYQSVLGLTAVAAGLVIGTQSLAMMISSGVIGGLSGSGKLPLKWVLIIGLLLFAGGVASIAVVAQPDSGQWAFVPGLVVSGIGLGCVWTPVFGLATRDMPPARAGVGAGVLDTVQEFGAVLATAVLGALMANRIAAELTTQTQLAAATLAEQAREPFLAGMAAADAGGVEVGAGQVSALPLPAEVPAGVAEQIHRAAQQVFSTAFTEAMRPTMGVAIVVILAAAAGVLFVRSSPGTADPRPTPTVDAESATTRT